MFSNRETRKEILGEQISKVGFIIEHTLIASIDEHLRCFLLYTDNIKIYQGETHLLNLQIADWRKLWFVKRQKITIKRAM